MTILFSFCSSFFASDLLDVSIVCAGFWWFLASLFETASLYGKYLDLKTFKDKVFIRLELDVVFCVSFIVLNL